MQYRGSFLPLLSLEDHTSAKPREDVGRLFVVVFDISGREVGMVAPKLEDIREVDAVVDAATLREPVIAGSIVISEGATRLVDLFELARVAHPDWFSERKAPEVVDEQQPTILLAEDSNFFRRQVKKYFEESGYSVVEACDGLEAWNLLRDGQQVDLVVTDIQMPNMDGFELCRRIKEDVAFASLPVIALTSLASEDNIAQGRAAGIDEYQVKMDREKLVHAVDQYAGRSSQRDGSSQQTSCLSGAS